MLALHDSLLSCQVRIVAPVPGGAPSAEMGEVPVDRDGVVRADDDRLAPAGQRRQRAVGMRVVVAEARLTGIVAVAPGVEPRRPVRARNQFDGPVSARTNVGSGTDVYDRVDIGGGRL